MTKVALIGLGRMGHGMAGRYLDAGFDVAVWNRSKAKAEDLIARGARWSTSPEDAAIDADRFVFGHTGLHLDALEQLVGQLENSLAPIGGHGRV